MSDRVWQRRAYDTPSRNDGYRVPVGRVWPRGVTRDTLALDGWNGDVAPSDGLRRWYRHRLDRWEEFRRPRPCAARGSNGLGITAGSCPSRARDAGLRGARCRAQSGSGAARTPRRALGLVEQGACGTATGDCPDRTWPRRGPVQSAFNLLQVLAARVSLPASGRGTASAELLWAPRAYSSEALTWNRAASLGDRSRQAGPVPNAIAPDAGA